MNKLMQIQTRLLRNSQCLKTFSRNNKVTSSSLSKKHPNYAYFYFPSQCFSAKVRKATGYSLQQQSKQKEESERVSQAKLAVPKEEKEQKRVVVDNIFPRLSILISLPFVGSSAYVLVTSTFFGINPVYLMNSAFFSFKALTLSQAFAAGINLGGLLSKLEKQLEKGENAQSFTNDFFQTFLPVLLSFGITQGMLFFNASLISLALSFGGYLCATELIIRRAKAFGEYSNICVFAKYQAMMNVIGLLFLSLFILLNLKEYNKRLNQKKSVGKLREIFELEDELYKVEIMRNKDLINEDEMTFGYKSHQKIAMPMPEAKKKKKESEEETN